MKTEFILKYHLNYNLYFEKSFKTEAEARVALAKLIETDAYGIKLDQVTHLDIEV